MHDMTTRASPNARGLVPGRTGYAVAVGVGLLLAVTGAFETGPAPLWLRLIYWVTVMMSGALIGTAVTNAVHGWGRLATNHWLEGALIAVGIALPLTLLVSGATVIAFGLRGFNLLGVAYMFGAVLMVSLPMVAINYLLAAQRRAGMVDVLAEVAAFDAEPKTDPAARFRERLPVHLRSANLLAVASEDHYLRIYTDKGEALILMRLVDALAELSDVPGAQTHRSWWVAKTAVTSVERGAGKATLQLVNGRSAPVSRSFLPVLVQQGWR